MNKSALDIHNSFHHIFWYFENYSY